MGVRECVCALRIVQSEKILRRISTIIIIIIMIMIIIIIIVVITIT